MNCPIKDKSAKSFAVFAHNPSQGPVEYLRIKTSHANYDVSYYVNDAKVKLPAEAICLSKYLEDGTHINDCDVFVNYKVEGFKVIVFDFNAQANLAIPETASGTLVI